jgi:predicted PurR-regulated permease PerM
VQESASGSLPTAMRALSISITPQTMFVAAAIVAVVWAFVEVRTAVITLFLALFSALVLEPVVTLAQRKLKLGRGPAALIVVFAVVAFALVAAFILIAPFVNAVDRARYSRLVDRLVD